MKITRKKSVFLLETMVNVDGFDTKLAVQLALDFESGGFKVKPNLLSKHGWDDEIKDALNDLIEKAYEMGEEEMDTFRQEIGAGKQGDLFGEEPDSAAG